MNNFLYYASNIHNEEEWLHFTDEGGETVFFRGSDIALVEIHLTVIQPEELLDDP